MEFVFLPKYHCVKVLLYLLPPSLCKRFLQTGTFVTYIQFHGPLRVNSYQAEQGKVST